MAHDRVDPIVDPSTWQADGQPDVYPRLTSRLEVDVLIVGGGLTGVLTAYLLAKAGIDVAVLEADTLGGGATATTTAFLTQVIDLSLQQLVTLHGNERARHIWSAGQSAITMLEQIVSAEALDTDFKRCPLYMLATNPRRLQGLQEEHDAASLLGFDTRIGIGSVLGVDAHGFLEVPEQAKFHPLHFIRALARRASGLGARIFTKSRVLAWSRTDTGFATTSDSGHVSSKWIILATHEPAFKNKVLRLSKAHYKSYVLEAEIAHSALRDAMFVDDHNPYHYVRIDAGDAVDRVIVGGEDHRADLPVSPRKCLEALETYLSTFLNGRTAIVRRRWSGPLIESTDGLPYIGEYRPNELIATAFSGNGMTYSAMAAATFRDQVTGQPGRWSDLFAPRRHQTLQDRWVSARHYVGEFFGGAARNTLR